MKNVLLSAAATAILGCPGDPTEANTGASTGSASADSSAGDDASISLTADDDGVSVSITVATDPTDTDPTDSDTGDGPECGDGMVELPETCDLGPNNTMGATCTDACIENVCGDGYVGYGESCDPPGRGCEADCILSSCGDGDVDVGEECDPPMAGVCLADCTLPGCGDAVIDPALGEQCEGNDLGNASCISLGHTNGTLQCDGACHFVETGCTDCGDGVLEAGEQCDGNLGAESCTTQGYDRGTLLCTACTLDFSGCSECSNGLVEGTEQCDGEDLAGADCTTLSFGGGVLDCALNCTFDTSMCNPCGNGVVEGMEQCDGVTLPQTMCSALMDPQWDQGELTCSGLCEYDQSDCCFATVGHLCEAESECCGVLECDNQEERCCQPAGGSCAENNNNACCSGNCNFGTDLCVGNDGA